MPKAAARADALGPSGRNGFVGAIFSAVGATLSRILYTTRVTCNIKGGPGAAMSRAK
jgi:hypothetical protein